jgi:cytochrome d ubiquinol oxidase subunit II
MLAAHGATYLTLKTEGPVHDRSEKWAKYLWIAVVPLLAVVLIESRIVRPDLPGRAWSNPFWWIGLVVVAASAFTLITGLTRQQELHAFVGSNFLIVGLLATGAAAIFPVMLHSTLAPENSLTAYAVASSSTTLLRASFWWPIGFALALFYFVFISRRYAGKVSVQRDTQGFY